MNAAFCFKGYMLYEKGNQRQPTRVDLTFYFKGTWASGKKTTECMEAHGLNGLQATQRH